MDASELFQTVVQRAKGYGFPEPILINAEEVTKNTRVVYTVGVESILIPGKDKKEAKHFALKFTKFQKVAGEWNQVTQIDGFRIGDKSLEKLVAYVRANQALLGIDLSSKEALEIFFSSDKLTADFLKRILVSAHEKKEFFELLRQNYPELDKKILTHKLVQSRKDSLREIENNLDDDKKGEIDYWQPTLEKNKWIFGLPNPIFVDDTRIDQWNRADFLSEGEDGFIDVIEIKDPHVFFWQKKTDGSNDKYRGFLYPSKGLIQAVTQGTNYVFQLEQKTSDAQWIAANGNKKPVKPNCTVIFGRSKGWGEEERTAFRLLNDSLHGISVITFDHLVARGQRQLKELDSSA